MAQVLIVDDEPSVRETFALFLSEAGHVVETAPDASSALTLLSAAEWDVVVSDIVMPGMSGVDLMDRISRQSDTKVILITGEPSLSSATAAIRSRAFDYLAKPVTGDALCRSVALAAQAQALERENRLYKEHLEAVIGEHATSLRHSEDRFRMLVSSMDDIVFTLDSAERYTGVYGRWLQRAGYTAGRFLGKTAREVFGADSAPLHEAANRRALAGEATVYEWRMDSALGVRIYQTSLSPLHNSEGRIHGLVGIGRDITVGKEAEKALLSLSHQLVEAQETERRHVARELHEVVAQSLTAIKDDLEAIAARQCDDALKESLGRVEQAIRQVQDLSLELRPVLLDDLGLEAALRWLVKRFSERAGLSASVDVALSDRLPAEVELALFRVAQEALANVVRHAHASSVQLECGIEDGQAQLAVQDDGVGFDVAAVLKWAAEGGSLGLLSIRERMTILGGQLVIESLPGAGAKIHATLPIVGKRPGAASGNV
jgi:PAS domain S-box-containing protein